MKGKIAKTKRRSKDIRAEQAISNAPFSVDDLASIQETIFSLQHADKAVEQYGWTSPLRDSPVKRRTLVSDAIVVSKPPLASSNSSVPQGLSRPTIAVLRAEAPSSSSLSTMLYQEKLKKYRDLLGDSLDIDRLTAHPLPPVKHTPIAAQPMPVPTPQLTSALEKENVLNTSTWSAATELPLLVLDKLRLAEQEYDLLLAKERKQALSKLQQMLAEGSKAHLDEVRRGVEANHRFQRKDLLKAIEQYAQQLVDDHLGDGPNEYAKGMSEKQLSAIPGDVRQALEEMVSNAKAERQQQLAREMRLQVLSTAKAVQDQRSVGINPSANSSNQHEEEVLREMRGLVEMVQAAATSVLMGSSSASTAAGTGQAAMRYELLRAVEKARIQQLRLRRTLTQQVDMVRTKVHSKQCSPL